MPRKTCSGICKLTKELSCFNANSSKKDGYNTICRECSNAHSRKYYEKNKAKQKKQILQAKNKRIEENKKFVLNLLKSGCVDCSESDPIVLEFDHLDNKVINISTLLSQGGSRKALISEINKCQIRCANCHRRKTAKQQNWLKYRLFNSD